MNNEAELKFLHNTCGYWDFPKLDDTKVVDTKYIHWPMHTIKNNQTGLYIQRRSRCFRKIQTFKKYLEIYFAIYIKTVYLNHF